MPDKNLTHFASPPDHWDVPHSVDGAAYLACTCLVLFMLLLLLLMLLMRTGTVEVQPGIFACMHEFVVLPAM
jgi:hypothetical protein